MNKLEQLIRDYLKEAKMMQLATSQNNQPWVCNVWFASDEGLNIYWFSSITRRHSQEVRNNPKVAAAICSPQTPEDSPRGLQLQGLAEELSNPNDVAKARSVYEGRVFDSETIDKFMAHPEKPHRFYRIKPSLFVLFDVVNFPDESRQEWSPSA
ncbi:MAG TPA: pyridoxamine 5'-phosphate oxidase family protein [Candidatus Saccharimonadales bacterium]|nr:pyridoxamine 5'-phosphate oxidase family protein [Candidatus Saccharimonadales bacterium]